MKKVDDGEKRKKQQNNGVIVPTNIVASRPPERQPTGTPHTCANLNFWFGEWIFFPF